MPKGKFWLGGNVSSNIVSLSVEVLFRHLLLMPEFGIKLTRNFLGLLTVGCLLNYIFYLCDQVGMTIAARKYDFSAATPFQVSDILNVQPVVKHSIPICSEAKDLVETGKVQLAEVCHSIRYAIMDAFIFVVEDSNPLN